MGSTMDRLRMDYLMEKVNINIKMGMNIKGTLKKDYMTDTE